MNEYLFFTHCFVMLSFLYAALYFGKEGVIAYISLCWLMANLFVTKVVVLFGFEVTATDVYSIGATLGLIVIQEFWGRKAAQTCVWINFLLLFFVAAQSLLHLEYAPSPADSTQPHFLAILTPVPRLFGASLLTYLVTQHFEIRLFSLLKRSSLPFFLRALFTEMVVQSIDTCLFSWIGLSGLVPSLTDIILVSYSIKLLIMLVATPFILFTSKIYTHDNVQV
jgi:uncharacterized integral membrane protein (TIGR00697 family)